MKLKRMAVVAAAAVVGPVILTATPALAQDNPALSVADTTPEGDAAASAQDAGQEYVYGPDLSLGGLPKDGFAAGGDWTEFSLKVDNTGKKALKNFATEVAFSGLDKHLAGRHVELQVRSGGNWHTAPKFTGIDAPVFDVLPGFDVAKDSVTEVALRVKVVADAPATGVHIQVRGSDHFDGDSKAANYTSKITRSGDEQSAKAPALTLAGLPSEFRAGADWREFALHVDNSGRPAVEEYSTELVLWTLDTFDWTGDDVELEIYAPDPAGNWGWHNVEADGSEEVYSFSLAEVDIEKDEVFDLKLRMKFGKETTPSRFSLSTTAEGGTADRVRYESRVTAGHAFAEGPRLNVDGLPQGGLKAGGDWTNLTARIDNSGKKAVGQFEMGLILRRPDAVGMHASQFVIEKLVKGENGKESWVPQKTAEGGDSWGITLASHPVAAGEKSEVSFRIRLTADAPVGTLSVSVGGFDRAAANPNETLVSDSPEYRVAVLAATAGDGTGTGTGTQTGNDAKPVGSVKPTGGNGGGQSTAPTTGGQLATTGADPATSWALGGAGVALAMGAALVAGTGRRRRPTA